MSTMLGGTLRELRRPNARAGYSRVRVEGLGVSCRLQVRFEDFDVRVWGLGCRVVDD